MGCFLTCFGSAKDGRRRRRQPNPKLTIDSQNVKCERKLLLQSNSANNFANQVSVKKVSPRLSCSDEKNAGDVGVENFEECREKVEIVSCPSFKKKVTFDLNVKTYEDAAIEEVVEEDEDAEKAEERIKEASFPVNHRYQDCAGSDEDDDDEEEDYGDDEYEDCEFSDEDDGGLVAEGNEESYDSFFCPSVEEGKNGFRGEVNSPKTKSCSDADEQKPTVLAKCNVRDRSQYVHSVLNPVENLTQWKEVKVRAAAPLKDLNKENVSSEPENKMPFSGSELIVKAKKLEWSVNSKTIPNYSAKQEVSVDASLSTWLISSDNSSVEGPQESFSRLSNSSMSREDRPILGALTVDDIKQSSVTSTPRKSPSRSPDETPIIGNVGRYWNSKIERDDNDDSCSSRKSGCDSKGMLNTKNNYSEDQRVNCNSIPFEVRLERALNNGTA